MWKPTDETTIGIIGLNLDMVWENIIKAIGEIRVQEGKTLTEQIQDDEQRVKTLKLIADLEKKMAKESQPRKKRELFEQIRKLKNTIQWKR